MNELAFNRDSKSTSGYHKAGDVMSSMLSLVLFAFVLQNCWNVKLTSLTVATPSYSWLFSAGQSSSRFVGVGVGVEDVVEDVVRDVVEDAVEVKFEDKFEDELVAGVGLEDELVIELVGVDWTLFEEL